MIKRLLSCVREYKKNTILTPVYVIIESFFEILIPTLMAFLIDYGISKKSMSNILWIGLGLVVASISSLIVGILAGTSAAKASSGFAKNLRHDMFYNVQKFSFSNIDRFSTGSIIHASPPMSATFRWRSRC